MKSQNFYQNLLSQILVERIRLDKKRGVHKKLSDLEWIGNLLIEVGEVAKAIIEGLSWDIIQGELIHCMGVIFSWIEDKENSNRGA